MFAGTPIGPAPLDLPAAVPIHRSLTELAVDGTTLATHDLRELGIFRPTGVGVDASGELRITDDLE